MTAKQRKQIPLSSGVLKYFPDALKEVARVSQIGNDQHHPGKPLHWDKPKSNDHEDAMLRHLMDHQAGVHWDDDTAMHLGKVAWRALAALQTFIDNMNNEEFEEEIIKKEMLYNEEEVEARMNVIGQNGNTGDHYSALNSATMTDYPSFHD